MKRIYVSATTRVMKDVNDPADRGEVYILDWDTREVVVGLDAYGPGYVFEGNSRGCAGIEWFKDKIYIVCRSGLAVFDPDSHELIEQIATYHPSIKGGHQLKARGDYLYVVSTGNNTIFKFDEHHNVVDRIEVTEQDVDALARHRVLEERPKRGWRPHINSIGWDDAGDMYLLFMAGGVVFNWTKRETVFSFGLPSSTHDLRWLGDGKFLVNQSGRGQTFVVNLSDGTSRCVRRSPTRSIEGSTACEGWLRGTAVDGNSLFLTSAPGTITQVDMTNWTDVASLEFATAKNEAPYDILLDPRDW